MTIMQMNYSAAVLILAIVILRAIALHKLPKRTFLILWSVVICRLLIPVSIPSPFSFYTGLSKVKRTFMEPAAVTPAAPAIDVAEPVTSAVPAARNIFDATSRAVAGSSSLLTVIWMAGVFVCALFFMIAFIKWRREFQTSLPVTHEAAERWLREHPLRRKVQLRQSDRVQGPLTYGIIRPVVLLPRNTDWRDETRLQYILTHEYVHIRRFDALTKLLLAFVLCVNWFNPLVWVMYVLANRDIELSCDEAVVQTCGTSEKSAYALALIGLEEKKLRISSLFSSFSQSAIEERIVAIMKMKKTSLAGGLLALILITGITTAFATSASSTGNSREGAYSTLESAENSILPDAKELSRQWAEAWRSRDGSKRYEIMSSTMQTEYRAEQQRVTGDPLNNVIRWSSPWVDGYGIELRGERVLITYLYKDSTGSEYKGTEWLSFGEESGKTVVTGCETEVELEPFPEG